MTKAAIALAFLISIALLGFGVGALILPARAAGMYGVPTTDRTAMEFVRATGMRDVGLGIWLLALLCTSSAHRLIGISLLSLAVIPAGDALIVYHSGATNLLALALHSLSIPVFLVLGWRLITRRNGSSAVGGNAG